MKNFENQPNSENNFFIINQNKKIIIMNNTAKIIVAAAAGAVAGAIAGILLAPDKGSETRKKMNAEGKKFAENIQEKFRSGKQKFNDLKENVEKFVKDKVDEFA